MNRGVKAKIYSFGVTFALLLFCVPSFLNSENIAKGNLIGFVYGKDGTTPLEGAVVKVMNASTGAAYESSRTDSLGIFKIEGVEKGIYIYAVNTAQGDYISDGMIGVSIRQNETAKLSISLSPFDEKFASAAQEIYRDQQNTGMSLVGRVIRYDPNSRMAEVFIEKGLLQLDDRMYAKGKNTNFYQDVRFLEFEGSSVKGLYAGQNAFIGVKKKVEIGDAIYTVSKTGIPPLYSTPLGSASVLAGSPSIAYSMIKVKDQCICPSPYKNWGNWWWWFWKYWRYWKNKRGG